MFKIDLWKNEKHYNLQEVITTNFNMGRKMGRGMLGKIVMKRITPVG